MNYEGRGTLIMGCILWDRRGAEGLSVVSFGYDLKFPFVVFQIISTDRKTGREGRVINTCIAKDILRFLFGEGCTNRTLKGGANYS